MHLNTATRQTEPMYQAANGGPLYRSDDGGRTWVNVAYEKWRPELAKAMSGDLYNIRYLDYLFSIRCANLLSTDKAAIVTRFDHFPGPEGTELKVKAIHGLAAAGELAEIRDVLIPRAEQWGREQGCTKAMISSREGWGRVLKDYRPHQVTLVKEL